MQNAGAQLKDAKEGTKGLLRNFITCFCMKVMIDKEVSDSILYTSRVPGHFCFLKLLSINFFGIIII